VAVVNTGPGVRHRVQQLPLGQPPVPLHQIGPQVRQQDVPAPEQHRPDLQEDQQERPQPERNGTAARPAREPHDGPGDQGEQNEQPENGERCSSGDGVPACGPDGRQDQPGAEQDGQFVDAADDQPRCRDPRDRERAGADGRPAELPHGLGDDRDQDRLDPVQDADHRRLGGERDVAPGEGGDHQGGGEDEAQPGDREPPPPGDPVADVDRHLGRVRAGDQVGRPEKVEELVAGQPPPAADDLVFHQGDVGGGSAERGEPEPQEHGRDLPERHHRPHPVRRLDLLPRRIGHAPLHPGGMPPAGRCCSRRGVPVNRVIESGVSA
jgi:hypothetical protein